MIALCLFVAVANLLSPFTETASPIPNAVHIGCFSTSFVNYHDYYKVNFSLQWQDCLNLCSRRLTKYAAVQSLPEYDYCYCGNDIADHSREASSLNCCSCLDAADRYCGAEFTMSVYQIPEPAPFAILLATDSGLRLFKNNKMHNEMGYNNFIRGVDFVYAKDEIYFQMNYSILRYSYKYKVQNQYNDLSTVQSGLDEIEDMVVDWVHNKVFWVNGRTKEIVEEDGITERLSVVLVRYNPVRNIAIDPYHGTLYFVEDKNYLYSYLVEKKVLTQYNKVVSDIYSVKKMAIDIHEQLIYLIAALDKNGPLHLVTIDFNDTKIQDLYSGIELSDTESLDVFKDNVFWVNRKDDQFSLYWCKLALTCHPDNLTIVYKGVEKIYDIRIYHPEKQVPIVKLLCNMKNCSHNCTVLSQLEATCFCPLGMILGADSRTCQVKTVKDGINDNTLSFEDEQSEGDLMLIKSGEGSSKKTPGNRNLSENLQKTRIKIPLPDCNRDHGSKMYFFELITICGFALVIALLTTSFYLLFRSKKSSKHRYVSTRSMELPEVN